MFLNVKICFSLGYVKQGGFSLSLYKLSIQILIVSSMEVFVNKESTPRLAMYQLWSCWQISSVKWNELITVYSLAVDGVKNFSKNFANLLAGVPITERIGWEDGSPLQVFLGILPNPYKMPGLEPTGFNFCK